MKRRFDIPEERIEQLARERAITALKTAHMVRAYAEPSGRSSAIGTGDHEKAVELQLALHCYEKALSEIEAEHWVHEHPDGGIKGAGGMIGAILGAGLGHAIGGRRAHVSAERPVLPISDDARAYVDMVLAAIGRDDADPAGDDDGAPVATVNRDVLDVMYEKLNSTDRSMAEVTIGRRVIALAHA